MTKKNNFATLKNEDVCKTYCIHYLFERDNEFHTIVGFYEKENVMVEVSCNIRNVSTQYKIRENVTKKDYDKVVNLIKESLVFAPLDHLSMKGLEDRFKKFEILKILYYEMFKLLEMMPKIFFVKKWKHGERTTVMACYNGMNQVQTTLSVHRKNVINFVKERKTRKAYDDSINEYKEKNCLIDESDWTNEERSIKNKMLKKYMELNNITAKLDLSEVASDYLYCYDNECFEENFEIGVRYLVQPIDKNILMVEDMRGKNVLVPKIMFCLSYMTCNI